MEGEEVEAAIEDTFVEVERGCCCGGVVVQEAEEEEEEEEGEGREGEGAVLRFMWCC